MRGIMGVVLPAVLVVTSLGAVPAGAQSPPQGDIAKRFFGAWRYVGTSIDGKPRPGRGAEPKGIIYYDPSGAMAAQIAPDRRVPMAGPQPTADEAKASLADYVACFRHLYDRRARGHHHTSSPGECAAGRAYRLCAQLRIRGRSPDPAPSGHQAGSGVGAVQVSACRHETGNE
jgi:Lipocalin-like domain